MLLSSPSPPHPLKVLLGGVSWDTISRAGTQEGADLVLALWTSCRYPGTPEGLRQPQQPPPCSPCSLTHIRDWFPLSLLQLPNDEQCLQLLRAPKPPNETKNTPNFHFKTSQIPSRFSQGPRTLQFLDDPRGGNQPER